MSSTLGQPDKEGPTVFISYSHDTPEHSQLVLELAWTLRDNGCAVEIDRFHQHEILDWQRWCRKQVKESRFVVCVCTAEFQRRLNGEVFAEDGKGVFWEGNFLLTEIYNDKGNSRFIPVLLGDEPDSSVDSAFGVPTRCRIHDFELADSGFEDLVRTLTGQPRVIANPVGSIPDLPTQTAPAHSNQSVTTVTTTEHLSRIAPSKLPRTGDYLIGRQLELRRLAQAWKNPKTCIVQIVAPGGVGKTQLVKRWRESLLDKDDHGGAVRAFDWSFYSQGTQQQASADDFFDKALRWFGEAQPENYKDPWAKGERLAELVRQQKTLLILDGMEPLQHPPGPMAGELTDPSINALLQGLQRDNPGLCVVTTREAVPTLDEMLEPKRVTVDLDRLSPQAGAELLGHYGVTGESDELRQASIDVDGHALALILLGTYLKARCGGDVRRRSEALLFQGHERYAAHAHKVMASYKAWFSQQDDTGRAAVAILRLMGLFNRPADAGCLAALRAKPPISGLTNALFVAGSDQQCAEMWQRAIERLRSARLLADESRACETHQNSAPIGDGTFHAPFYEVLDAHPLVREYFAVELTEQPDAAREAHRRLYEHLKQSAPELPDNLNDMMPLYHAVVHGCKCGEHELANSEVYYPRICREQEDFAVKQLGAAGLELAFLSAFFEEPWTIVDKNIKSVELQASLLSVCGFLLQCQGRFVAANRACASALYIRITKQIWSMATIDAIKLAEISVTLGNIAMALKYAEYAVELADRTCRITGWIMHPMQIGSLPALGHVLHCANRLEMAHFAFADAKAAHEKLLPNLHLHSISGYQYCELLLDLKQAFGLLGMFRSDARSGWSRHLCVG